MPVVELTFLRLQKLLGSKVSKKTIIETLPFLGLDIEAQSANTIRVEYSPNRPDYSTDYGIALGLEGLLGIKKGNIELKTRQSNYQIKVTDPLVSSIRPFVTGICAKSNKTTKNVIDQNTIKQLMAMQEDLHFGIGRKRKKSSIGIHDLDTILFPLEYKTASRSSHELVPLNQTKPMTIQQILDDTQTGQDYGHLLGSSKRVPIIMDSAGNTVSLPPIINAALTTITTKTKNLFVEVTGMNKNDIEDTLSVIATILQKAGFTLYTVKITGAKNYTPVLEPRKIIFDPKLVSDTLGLDCLSINSIVSCLKKSRIGIVNPVQNKNKKNKKRDNQKIQCVIPRYRFDIFGPMDIIEEIALGYGIAKLEPKLSASQTLGDTNTTVKNLRIVDDMLIGLGYTEALNSSLTSASVLYNATNRDTPMNIISVLDSKSQAHTILRDSILPGLVDNLAGNIHQTYPQKIYETGTVFLSGNNSNNPIREQLSLAAVLAYKDANYSELKSVLQSAFAVGFNFDIQTKTMSINSSANSPLFEAGRAADVLINGKTVGHIGQISSKTLDRLKIRVPVIGFEIKLTGLIFD